MRIKQVKKDKVAVGLDIAAFVVEIKDANKWKSIGNASRMHIPKETDWITIEPNGKTTIQFSEGLSKTDIDKILKKNRYVRVKFIEPIYFDNSIKLKGLNKIYTGEVAIP